MRSVLILSFVTLVLAACSSTGDAPPGAIDYGPGIRPIKGSITYGDQGPRRSDLPPGYKFSHEFYDAFGSRVQERYRITDDGILELYSRRVKPITISNGR